VAAACFVVGLGLMAYGGWHVHQAGRGTDQRVKQLGVTGPADDLLLRIEKMTYLLLAGNGLIAVGYFLGRRPSKPAAAADYDPVLVAQPVPPPPPLIKVRCLGCRSLNDEVARFCNQCGQPV
jgi:hypothetical protein